MLGELCGICGATLREGSRFCGRCGGEVGAMVPRDAAVGRVIEERARPARLDPSGLTAALLAYFSCLGILLFAIARGGVDDLRTVDLLILGAAALWFGVFWRANLALLRWPVMSLRGAALATLAVAALAVAVHGLRLLVPQLFMDELLLFNQDAGVLAMLIDGALLPAIGEELAFRGVILSGLLGVFRRRTALIISAAMFATMHLSMLSFVHLGVLGLLLGVVRLRTRSIYPCIVLHAGYNTAILLLAL